MTNDNYNLTSISNQQISFRWSITEVTGWQESVRKLTQVISFKRNFETKVYTKVSQKVEFLSVYGVPQQPPPGKHILLVLKPLICSSVDNLNKK